jgi:hypothetical protein
MEWLLFISYEQMEESTSCGSAVEQASLRRTVAGFEWLYVFSGTGTRCTNETHDAFGKALLKCGGCQSTRQPETLLPHGFTMLTLACHS